MNDIFRKRNMSYNSRNSSVFETRNIKTLHYASESIVDLCPEIWDLSYSAEDKRFRKY